MLQGTPFFSIIVPTRNRPAILRRALTSIAEQSCTDFEVIIVDDGSSTGNVSAAQSVIKEFGERFVFIRRDVDESQHGPSVSRNTGALHARGIYLGFLDDDDYWCDNRHLELAQRCLQDIPEIDVHVANQVAKRGTEVVVSPWLPYLDRVVTERRCVANSDTFELRRSDFLQPEGIGFAHVNMCIIKKSLFQSTGGFWNEVRYEEDLNFFLRLMDKGEKFVYRAATVSVNTLRERDTEVGASSINDESKLLLRTLICQHAQLRCVRPEVRKYLRLLHGGALKKMARSHYLAHRFRIASELAAQAVTIDPSIRWSLIAVLLKLRFAASFLRAQISRSPPNM